MKHASRHSAIFVAVSLSLVALTPLGWLPPPPFQLILLVALVTLLGLPHGAMDPLVARQSGLFKGPADGLRFSTVYLSQAITAVFFWLLFPFIALPAFLVMSAWHFASDWRDRLPKWLGMLGGATVILAPIVFHGETVALLFGLLSDTDTAEALVAWLRIPGWMAIGGLIVAVIAFHQRLGWAGLELATIVLLAWALPPLLYFAVYFCGLHSPRHAVEVISEYRIEVREALKVSVAFTVLALAFAAVFYLSSDGITSSEKTVRILFISLAALTVPHMLLLAKTGKRLAQQSPA